MANMSYCQFHNTELAVRQLVDSINDGDPISKGERDAARKLMSTLEDLIMAIDGDGFDLPENLKALENHFKRLDHPRPREQFEGDDE